MGLSVNQLHELSFKLEVPETPAQFPAFQHAIEALAAIASQRNQKLTATLAQVAESSLSHVMAQLQEEAGEKKSAVESFIQAHTVTINAVLSTFVKQIQFPYTIEPSHLRGIFEHHPEEYRIHPDTAIAYQQCIIYSPGLLLLEKLRTQPITIHDLHWRQLEEIVAELLAQEGYEVTLGPGSKDGGRDIVAAKHLPYLGQVLSVWQAKKMAPHNKVGLNVIRLLDYTRFSNNASKGVIVTTTSLTRDALDLINQKPNLLYKVEGKELHDWIHRSKQP